MPSTYEFTDNYDETSEDKDFDDYKNEGIGDFEDMEKISTEIEESLKVGLNEVETNLLIQGASDRLTSIQTNVNNTDINQIEEEKIISRS